MTKDLHVSTAIFPCFVIFCDGLCNIETLTKLEERKSYIQVSAGAWHTVLLWSHGRAFAFGENILTDDALSRPSTRGSHTPGLCGWSAYGASPKWRLRGGLWGALRHPLAGGGAVLPSQVSSTYTLLLRSDGCVVARRATLRDNAIFRL